MINETINILEAHQVTAVPALIILFIAMLLIFLIVGLVVVKQSRHKVMLIWGVSAVFGVLILLALCFMPNLTQTMADFFRGMR